MRLFLLWVLLLSLVLTGCASSPHTLKRPNGVAVAEDGTLYVMDRGNYRVVHLDAQGTLLGSFGKFGARPEQIHSGWDLARDAAGRLYFGHLVYSEESEVVHDGVKVFAADGTFIGEIGARDYAYGEATARPYGLDVDQAGRVYVADFASNTLRIFNPTGDLIALFASGPDTVLGDFHALNDVAVDDQRGLIYLVDNLLAVVRQYRLTFDAQGQPELTLLRSFGEYGHGPGQLSYPQYLAVNEASGEVYVSDMGNQRVLGYDSSGLYVRMLVPPADPWQAMGVTVGSDGRVYVADALNNVIWAFAPDGSATRIEVRP